MRILIAARVFLAVFGTVLLVGLVSQYLLSRALQQGFSAYVAQMELQRLAPLQQQLQQLYAQQQRWPILSECQQRFWLGHQLMLADRRNSNTPEPPIPPLPQCDAVRTAAGQPSAPPPPPPNWPSHTPMPPTNSAQRPLPPNRPPPEAPERLMLFERLLLVDAAGRHVAGLPSSRHTLNLPLSWQGQPIGHLSLVVLDRPNDALSQAFFADQRQQLWWIGGSALLASAVVAALLAQHFRRPIQQLMLTAAALSRRQFTQRVVWTRSDELGQLGESINRLAELLDAHERAQQQWVSDTSHELRTPVAVLQAQIEALQDGVRQATPEHLAAMQRQVGQLTRLITDLQALSQADAGQLLWQPHSIEADTWLAEQWHSMVPRLQQAQLQVQAQFAAAGAQIRVDPQRLQQVLGNVLENSCRYTDAGGAVHLRTWCDAQRWYCQIDDSAPSVPSALLPRLGDRFFRVDVSRQRATGGSGLGLAVSKQLLSLQGGQLQFAASPLGGLAVQISVALATPIHKE